MLPAAVITDTHETSEWTRFELDFNYEHYGKTIDPQKLANGGYNVSIVLSASKDGDDFKAHRVAPCLLTTWNWYANNHLDKNRYEKYILTLILALQASDCMHRQTETKQSSMQHCMVGSTKSKREST